MNAHYKVIYKNINAFLYQVLLLKKANMLILGRKLIVGNAKNVIHLVHLAMKIMIVIVLVVYKEV